MNPNVKPPAGAVHDYGPNYLTLCDKCGGSKLSLNISNGMFNCFTCDNKGKDIRYTTHQFLRAEKEIDLDILALPKAIDYLISRGIENTEGVADCVREGRGREDTYFIPRPGYRT